ncbi:hypothetical protein BP5796_06809 [Coleophoma crateriformis]|uniref:Uncharacterized protein n=1 Tax=Coleophoma crateriformis TaxID=565419 RepID=A0A3D8RPW0_9HELO|nr:hypothetical protein BP5796_06809 [Coleophoma crateriformis]
MEAVSTFGEGTKSMEGNYIEYAQDYGYYWFGPLPENLEITRGIHYRFLLKLASFMLCRSPQVVPNRTFIRNSSSAKDFGNTRFSKGNIFRYDDRIDAAQNYDLIRCMAHEIMAHLLAPKVHGPDQIEEWLYEGIANAFSICLPFRPPIQFRDGKYHQATLNMLCQKYYTSPMLHAGFEELQAQATNNEYAREQLSARAWAFVVCTDFRARDLVGGKVGGVQQRPVEDLAVKVMIKSRHEGKPYGLQQWFERLEPLMGDESKALFTKMDKGEVFVFRSKHWCQNS